jgi:outer membrane protein OmpA-like peptidoglycan-associated protein
VLLARVTLLITQKWNSGEATVKRTLQAYSIIALLLVLPSAGAAQQRAQLDTVGQRAGAVGVHFLAGGFVGRMDLTEGGSVHLAGGQLGVGLGELVSVTGWYWRAFDRDAGAFTADAALGGELQLNLNAGLGVTPFVAAGISRVNLDPRAAQTAAVVGGGLMLPLGPLLLHVGARDYIFGVTGLRGADSPEDITHNWKLSAGVLAAIGRGRPERAVVVRRPDAARELAALRDSLALAAARQDAFIAMDTSLVVVDGDTVAVVRARPPAQAATGTAGATPRNYQSDQRIEIPLPTWGSITLRYGPEPEQAAAPPIIVQAPAPPPATTATAAPAGVSPPATTTAPPPSPTFILPPQQQPQLVLPQQPAGEALTQGQLDALAQRVLDGVRFTLLPQLDAAQAQRLNALRDEMRREFERLAAVQSAQAAPGAAAAAVGGAAIAPPQAAAQAPAPAALPEGRPVAAPAQAAPVVELPAPSVVRGNELDAAAAELEAARQQRAVRESLAAVAARQPLLGTGEASRGPALVLGDAAFAADGLNLDAAGRAAITAVAEFLRAHPGHAVFVEAHVDATRSELESQRLSELRAEAVRSMLVRSGVAADRLYAVGYGHARPAATGATAAGRVANRRVEIVIGGSS